MKKLIALIVSMVMLFGCLSLAAAEGTAFTAGSYTASADGNNGPVTVEVTFSSDAITEVKVTDHSETPSIASSVIEVIPAQIVENQSVAVDTIAGAMVTSKAILTAVEDCIRQAGADPDNYRVAIEKQVEDLGDRTTDVEVLVIGGGGTGLAAAMSAIDNGAKNVMVVEKQIGRAHV